jgi:hypothetical protein
MAIKQISAFVGVLVCCLPASVAAQDYSVPVYIGPWDFNTPWIASESINNMVNQNMLNAMLDDSSKPDGADANTAPQSSPATGATSSLAFRFSQQRSDQNLSNFVARTPDPTARAFFEQLVAARPGLMEDIGRSMRRYGFDPHNIADAYAAWWINIWGISEKQNVEPDAATVEAVKRQVHGAFAAAPDLAKTSEAERQEYAETMILQAALLGAIFEQVKGDPAQLDQLAEVARQGAKERGIDLSLITLSDKGFVSRKGG